MVAVLGESFRHEPRCSREQSRPGQQEKKVRLCVSVHISTGALNLGTGMPQCYAGRWHHDHTWYARTSSRSRMDSWIVWLDTAAADSGET